MGVLNCTPDSFFAGSRSESAKTAVEAGRHMLTAGADLLDIADSPPGRARLK